MTDKHVLIVEDDPDQAEALARVLVLYGLTAEVAGTLALALARLRADDVGCVLLDLTLPDATGVAGVTALVRDHPTVPVVVLTGSPDAEVECLEAGAQEVLVKPGDPESLVRAIQTATARHKVRSEYRPYTRALESAVEKLGELVEAIPGKGGAPKPPKPPR